MATKSEMLKKAIALDKAKKNIEHKLAMIKTELASRLEDDYYESDNMYIRVNKTKRFNGFNENANEFVPVEMWPDVAKLDRKKVDAAVKEGKIDEGINRCVERKEVTAIYIGVVAESPEDV